VDLTLTGVEDYGRFGFALASVDINADGFDDLAIASPTLGGVEQFYSGKVEIFFGSAAGLSLSPDVSIIAADKHTNLGWSLSSGDANNDGINDLLIGSPHARAGGVQKGSVHVFLSDGSISTGAVLSPDDADWILGGENNHDWFGYEVKTTAQMLVVGAPRFDADGIQSLGRLYGFDLADLGQANPTPVFTLSGVQEFEKAATSFAIGDFSGDGSSHLLLSSPTFNQGGETHAGIAHLLNLEDLFGDLDLNDIAPLAAFSRNQQFSRFGWKALGTDINGDGADDLLLTHPRKSSGLKHQRGAAYLWLGGENLLDSPMPEPHWTFEYDHDKSRFGSAAVALDFNGDSAMDLVIGAPGDNKNARLSGVATVLITPRPLLETVSPDTVGNGRAIALTVSGKNLLDQDLTVRLSNGSEEIAPLSISPIDADTLQIMFDLGGALGTYSVAVKTLYGYTELADALLVEEPTADDDDDDDAGPTDDDDDTDSPTGSSDSDDDDGGGGC
jgi:FG-GAP repeat